MTDEEKMQALDELFAHVWMVRTFLKHAEETEEDEELQEVHRTLYDCMHALGPAAASGDAAGYCKAAKKKLKKLKQATELFLDIQPEISSHTNYQMSSISLKSSVREIAILLES